MPCRLTMGKGAFASSGCEIGYFGASNSTFADTDRPDLQLHAMVTAGDEGFFKGCVCARVCV